MPDSAADEIGLDMHMEGYPKTTAPSLGVSILRVISTRSTLSWTHVFRKGFDKFFLSHRCAGTASLKSWGFGSSLGASGFRVGFEILISRFRIDAFWIENFGGVSLALINEPLLSRD